MGSVEEEIEYWTVQKATLQIRNNSLNDDIDKLEGYLKEYRKRLKILQKQRHLNQTQKIICENHITDLGGIT
tara:strand:+ start:473 stop:688 length:216 start_codon:yes stop_codon:yes gene_type:complete